MIPLPSSGLRAFLAVAMLALAAAPARGDDSVGVVVTGEAMMQPQLTAQLETWLRMHGHELVSTPLPPEAVSALIDCFVLEDQGCARKVVEQRAKADSIVFAQVNVTSTEAAPERAVTLTAHWLDKGKTARSERRTCERCTDVSMRKAADELMAALTGDDGPRGRVKLRSRPDGATVSIGGQPIGETPLAHRLPPGMHELVFELEGRPAEKRIVTIDKGQVRTVTVAFPSPPLSSRQKLGIGAIAGGVALGIGGALLITVLDGDDDPTITMDPGKRYYYDTAPAGVALAASGALVVGAGVYLLVTKPSRRSVPTAAVVPGGGVVGWAGRF